MKKFKCLEIEEAIEFAQQGGQALHLHQIIMNPETAPRCFVSAVNRGEDIAHLFDQNLERLKETVRKLGVRVVFVDKLGTPNQHVDLCGKPLRLAKALCSED